VILISLYTPIRSAILLKSIILRRLVLAAARVTGVAAGVVVGGAVASIRGLATLFASLSGVDLAVREFAGADALVRLTVLAEAVVLFIDIVLAKNSCQTVEPVLILTGWLISRHFVSKR
jgi:hypothetical protein